MATPIEMKVLDGDKLPRIINTPPELIDGKMPVLLASVPLPTGAATDASLAAIKTALGSPLQAGGGVTVTNTVPVTGTFFPPTQPVSLASAPLPAGAATDASLVALKTAIGSPLQAGGAVSISGTPTVTVTGVATAANQTSANTSLATIATNTVPPTAYDTVVKATSANRSTSAGTTASTLMAANAARRGFVVQNQSTSASIYVNGLAAATADSNSLLIGPGGYYETQAHHCGTGAISVIATAASTPVYAREF